jgi:signal transduction histidine kinase
VARLHSRIYLHSLAVLVVVGVAIAIVFAFGARDAFRRQMAHRMPHHLASLVSERMHDPAALAARLAEIHEDLHVDLRVRDLDGRVMASAGDEVTAAGDHEIAFPIRDASGALVGYLETSPPRPPGPPPLWRPVLTGVLILTIVAVATRPLSRRIAGPLERLTQAARRLGAGDLTARVPTKPSHGARTDEITELTLAFNEMADRVERLVRTEKELLANVSHELRSPLARIRVALELLPRGTDDRHLRDVERDLAELDRLIEDVLTTARLDASGLPAHLGAVDARALLGELAERARRDPLTAGTAVRVEDGPSITLTADEALLRRALWNLIENGAKYGAPPITLSASRDSARVHLVVRDEGPGIPPGDRERVFSPFYRGGASPRMPDAGAGSRRGVGLGLTLARRVAEVHGGGIAIEDASETSGEPRGCRVVMSLPA